MSVTPYDLKSSGEFDLYRKTIKHHKKRCQNGCLWGHYMCQSVLQMYVILVLFGVKTGGAYSSGMRNSKSCSSSMRARLGQTRLGQARPIPDPSSIHPRSILDPYIKFRPKNNQIQTQDLFLSIFCIFSSPFKKPADPNSKNN